ncbi:16S rRNA (cytidine(1402)-2'-O)-methyltransferase [Dehalococcoidia bacterium]|nr:16S rRNA (cytidine(1402)-2'-O)-methyltransferase [Dehalococcoidia bacterium]
MSTLYVVATPIGNLEDVTLRAIRVLHEVGLIAAEDTRRTKRLLSAYQIKTPLTSYHEHNKRAKLPYLLRALEHGDVALISEAGMPGINDPGYDLVLAAIDRDAKVVPVPGPSAIPAALAVSGLTTEQFIHLGFLPRKKGARRKLLQSIAAEPRTIVAFETPHRLRSALVDLGEVLGERRLAICREMTKLHEEIFRGTVSQAIEHFAKPRGEFTLVIEGKAREPRCADRPRPCQII